MMTIKAIKDGNEVTLCEAKLIKYERKFYENKAVFIQQYKASGREVEMLMMFPEDDYSFRDGENIEWDKSNPRDKTEYIQINFIDGDDLGRIIFIQKGRVYIMQGGQTVDTIYC
jgi:hypothetical protein